jgi:hypothetical protein
MATMTDLTLHLRLVGVILIVLGAVHVLLPRQLRWKEQLALLSPINREVSYVHCYFIALMCEFWGWLALTAAADLVVRNPVSRAVLIGGMVFWASRLVIQLTIFNAHARRSRPWLTLSILANAMWLYITVIWAWALTTQF